MTLYEVHSALARSLGDPFAETALSTIYDGVRYSKQARQGYLYRACCSIINEVVSQLVALPQEQCAEIVSRLFPNMISRLPVATGLGSDIIQEFDLYNPGQNVDSLTCAYLLNAYVYDNSTVASIPVPIVSSHKARKITSRGARSQMNDPMIWITHSYKGSTFYSPVSAMKLTFHMGGVDWQNYFLEVQFLRYPLNQALTDGTAEFDFEQSYMNAVLNKATLYGMTDGGDLTPEQILPLLSK